MEWPHSSPQFGKKAILDQNVITLRNKEPITNEFYNYALNYKRSARIIVEKIVENQKNSELDSYFFSVAFLSRHSLELLLKAIGLKYIVDKEKQIYFLKDTFHNLLSLLLEIEPFIKIKNKDAVIWLKAYFKDVEKIDKESDSFRYPFSIKYERIKDYKRYYIEPFINKQTHIDLIAFINKIEVAFDILTSIYNEKDKFNDHYNKYNPIFLEEGGLYHFQSVIGYSYAMNEYYLYIRAYIESAELLYNLSKEDSDLKNIVFTSMCYLYRNGLELSMKEILFKECSYEFQKGCALLKDCSHSLIKIWKHIKQDIIEHANASEDHRTIEFVEKYLTQLHTFDGAADKFRYPTDKELQIYFKNPKKLDIENINIFFKEITNFFSGVSSMMSSQNEWKAEMENEYLSEMRAYNGDW